MAKHCSCYVWVILYIFILGGGHFGRDKTLQKVCSRFFWHNVHADVRSYVRSCDKCQRTNAVLKKQPGQLHPISIQPQVCKRVGMDLIVSLTTNIQPQVWKSVGIDLIGPLTTTRSGNKYIITCTDYFSKWVEAEGLPDKTAHSVAKFLFRLICRLGCFESCHSDQGREFINELNSTLFKLAGIKHKISSAYHPQSNGLDERTNQTISHALLKLININQDDWDEFLDCVLFSYRTSVHASTNYTPFYLMYGRDPVLPIELMVRQLYSSFYWFISTKCYCLSLESFVDLHLFTLLLCQQKCAKQPVTALKIYTTQLSLLSISQHVLRKYAILKIYIFIIYI